MSALADQETPIPAIWPSVTGLLPSLMTAFLDGHSGQALANE
jgi:hypothetical protein